MDLYARINILDGRAVRLPKGDVREAISLDSDPVARAVGWVAKGADRLFVVDLDAAAYRDDRNRTLIGEIVDAVDVPVYAAGGIRSAADVSRMLDDLGVAQVGMGTAAINNVTLDVLPNEELATRGWTAGSGRFLEEVLISLSSAGVAGFHVQAANRDALTEPSNLGILAEALTVAEEPVIASGGARDLKDLAGLRDLEAGGRRLDGVIVGREITEGRFTVEEAQALIGAG
jgi:phosphoribosylformimino-5-aminoimidazole carboxamide ribonucleotide (ProFAR) isomerase